MKKPIKMAGLILAVVAVAGAAFAFYNDITPIAWGMHSRVYTADGYALRGYDPVTYFEGSPGKGTVSLSYDYAGSTWLFATEANRDRFIKSPDQFMPRFGGYCAKAISTGFTAPGDPTIFTIRDGALFIFSSQDLKAEFLADPETFIAACDRHWQD